MACSFELLAGADAVIFDCDGVLVDSEPIANRVLCALFAANGRSLTPEASTSRYVGRTLAAIVDSIRQEFGAALADIVARDFTALTLQAFERELAAMPGVERVLDALGLPSAVGSSSRPDRLNLSLRVAGLEGYFNSHVYSATQVERGKPAPDLFLLAAARLGVPPTKCVVFEDGVAGVQAALSAGMRPIGFVGGGHILPGHADRLLEAGAERVLSHWNELC